MNASDLILPNLFAKTGCDATCGFTVRQAGSQLRFEHRGKKFGTTPTMKDEDVIGWLIEKLRSDHV